MDNDGSTDPNSSEKASNRRLLTRNQVLKWRSNWSTNDIKKITENLDRLAIQRFEEPHSNVQVDCYNSNGMKVMEIRPGYAKFMQGFELPDPDDPDRKWLTFTTYKPYSKSNAGVSEEPEICKTCFMALPLSGKCDECD